MTYLKNNHQCYRVKLLHRLRCFDTINIKKKTNFYIIELKERLNEHINVLYVGVLNMRKI